MEFDGQAREGGPKLRLALFYLSLVLVCFAGAVTLYMFVEHTVRTREFIHESRIALVGAVLLGLGGTLLLIRAVFLLSGLFTIRPGQAVVLVERGVYKGTQLEAGFYWVPHSTAKQKVSLRLRNSAIGPLAVKDRVGRHVEITAQVIWQIQDTYKSTFGVENLDHFFKTEAEMGLKCLAHEMTLFELPSDLNGPSSNFKKALQARSEPVGIAVKEARIVQFTVSPCDLAKN
jgi:regulator of protease activity HflC (stomatin/prohibitin superfamily)